jgi:hypothetical protein
MWLGLVFLLIVGGGPWSLEAFMAGAADGQPSLAAGVRRCMGPN